MVTVTFPWLTQLGCGCFFSRILLTTGEEWRHWDPCGAHVVLAATGAKPAGWPPRVDTREPVPA